MAVNLTDDDDPLLFSLTLPEGVLILQWAEVLAALAKSNVTGTPEVQQVADAIRKVARSKDVAAACSDERLFAAFARIGKVADAQGNG